MPTPVLRSLFVAVILVTTACTATDEPVPTTAPFVHQSLCEAVAAGTPDDAREAFGRAHEGLHELARELQEVDRRAVAGALLEAKQEVEAALATSEPPADLRELLTRLTDATADGLTATGLPRPTCDEGSR